MGLFQLITLVLERAKERCDGEYNHSYNLPKSVSDETY